MPPDTFMVMSAPYRLQFLEGLAMHTRFALLPPLLFLALLTVPAAFGDAPKVCEPMRLDRYGDPLPHGVVARLGTERLTLNNAIFTFSPDGRRLAAHDNNRQLRVWEVDSGKEVLRLATGDYTLWWGVPLVFSPDS